MSYQSPLERVPYFAYIEREHGENPEATKELGYAVPKLVTFIQITPHGHKGEPMEFHAEEFIERKGKEAREGRYDHQWVESFKTGLKLFKEGKELPREGTPLLTWERILTSRRKELAARFPTVEDLAAVPDSSLGDIGMDGRVLRDLAKGDIQAKRDMSPIVKELADAKEENRRLQEQMSALAARLDAVESTKLHLKKAA